MEFNNLDNFVRGWFVGGFEPTVLETTDVEVAVQKFKKGEIEASHCHKVATEITVVISGCARMGGRVLQQGDIVKIMPGEYSAFEAMEDTVTVVVKHPGVLKDKYLEEQDD